MTNSNRNNVKEFHEKFGVPVRTSPQFPHEDERQLRRKLLREEFEEYMESEEQDDLVNIARELADMIYIIYGTSLSYGIPLDVVFNEIHRSNMSKLDSDGKPIIREDGKILKSDNFAPPNTKGIIDWATKGGSA